MLSENYLTWSAILDLATCVGCRSMHGKIYRVGEWIIPEPPLHPNCRCVIEKLKAVFAGEATRNGKLGADWWLKNFGELPKYYISKDEAESLGWCSWKGNLNEVLPGRMITKGVYENRNEHLPTAPGRIWYEADINYTEGYRGLSRIVFSNDGLIFVTYDHYMTFYEVV